MFGKMSSYNKSFMKHSTGVYGGLPRIQNITQTKDIYGFAQVNQMATTAYSRTKVHKGYFTCDPADIAHGDLIYDRGDQNHYLVMSVKNEIFSGESAYLDGTLFFCDAQITIKRFGTDPVRDAFGRMVEDAAVTVGTPVYEDVYCMINPKNFDVLQQEDRPVDQNKLQVCLQKTYLVEKGDRLETLEGDVYVVQTIDRRSLPGLQYLGVDTDVR